MTDPIEPFAPEALEDPYPTYDRLRAECPVYEIPGAGIWLVCRHADVVEANERPRDFSSRLAAMLYAGGGDAPAMLEGGADAMGAADVLATQDPPVHTRQRRLVNRAFVPAKINALEPVIRAMVDAALEPALDRGRIEWMEDLAVPIPVEVITDLIGLPEADRGALRRWADQGVELLSGVAPPERMGQLVEAALAFLAYLKERLTEAMPAPREDVLGLVARAVASAELTETEGFSLLLQLVIAGSESTTSLMGSAVRMLAERPSLQDELRASPARVAPFLEEALRLESPFRGHFRVATRDAELGGVRIPAGARLMLMWGAGNRDPGAFDDPASLDLGRPRPKAHLGFGSGIHSCIGAPLARMEARVAVQTLLARTSSFRLASGEPPPRHVPSLFVRRLASLPLALDPAPGLRGREARSDG